MLREETYTVLWEDIDPWLRGYSGLPVEMYGPPTPDRYGDPFICQWVIDPGYRDLR
jgi:hypothetical protein